MQLEHLPRLWREDGLAAHLPPAWRVSLAQLGLAWLATVIITAREWGEMLHQWWNIDTYNHILLIPIIVAGLVALRGPMLAKLRPNTFLPGLGLVVLAMSLWLVGRLTGINLFAHAGAVGALQAVAVTILGPRVVAALLLPVAMMTFLVPFGDEIVPQLQMITADIAIALTHWSGVPATIEGIYIDTPVGLFIVAEACSGVKFLVAMVTLGVLVSFTAFESWKRRAIFMTACVVVPIIANGIRAWGTIYIAQSQGVIFAESFDHIFYGWIFFAIVVAIVIGAAWRFFERDPEEAGLTIEQIEANGLINRLSSYEGKTGATLAGLAAFLASFLAAAIYASSQVM